MDKYSDTFTVEKSKKDFIVFRSKRINIQQYETPQDYSKDVAVVTPTDKLILTINKIFFKPNEIIFRFNNPNREFQNKLKATIHFKNIYDIVRPTPKKVVIKPDTLPKPVIKPVTLPKPVIKPVTLPKPIIKPVIRNPYIYTNVESGYSAKSFPSFYVQKYKYGPQGDKMQTTPQVAPVYSPS